MTEEKKPTEQKPEETKPVMDEDRMRRINARVRAELFDPHHRGGNLFAHGQGAFADREEQREEERQKPKEGGRT